MRKSIPKRFGNVSEEWKKFRDAKYERDGGETIRCECYKLGFKKCYQLGNNLHHIVGRNEEPQLYYDENNLVWLSGEHHNMVHELMKGNI